MSMESVMPSDHAILCRPFSREAYAEYTRLSLLSGAGRRAVHPWDSRVFDRENGFVPVYTSAYDPCVAVTSGDIGENVPEDGQEPS